MENREFGNKQPHKFNIVDVFLIIIIAAAIGILVYILMGNNLIKSSQNITILYKIEIKIIKNAMLPDIKKLQAGNEILDSVRNQPIGAIYDVEIADAMFNLENNVTGVVQEVLHPEHSTVTLTVKTQCEKTDIKKYYVGGKNIMVGTRIDFRTQNFIYSGYCIYLEEIEND